MNNKELLMSRTVHNADCLLLLADILHKHPELRLEQVLYILDEQKDYFNEEPGKTFQRWSQSKLNKQDDREA